MRDRGRGPWRIQIAAVMVAVAGGCGAGILVPDGGASSAAPSADPAAPTPGDVATQKPPSPAVVTGCAPTPALPSWGQCEGGQGNWCWENPQPLGEDILAVGGTSVEDLWVLTSTMVLHRAAGTWTKTMDGVFLTGALHAIGPSDVWLVAGYQPPYTEPAPNSLAPMPDYMPPTVWHWDGSAWTLSHRLASTGGGLVVTDIWAVGSGEVWAAGYGTGGGALAHFDGKTWSNVQVDPDQPSLSFNAVWGSAADDVWTVATPGSFMDGRVYHFDGRSWTLAAFRPDEAYSSAMSGTGSGDVWVGGTNVLGHFDGTTWLAHPIGGNRFYVPVSLGPRDVWALPSLSDGQAGHVCTLSHFDGTEWTNVTLPPGPGVGDCFSHAVGWPGGALVGGGSRGNLQVLTCGGSFAPLTRRTAGPSLAAVWAFGFANAWAVGAGGLALRTTSYPSWTAVPTQTSSDLYALWASGPNDVWTVGEGGVAVHWDGAHWTPEETGAAETLVAVSGSGPSDVWAVTGSSPAAVVRFDGQGWSLMFSQPNQRLTGVAAIAPDDVWIAAGDGFLHWDGAGFSHVDSPAGPDAPPYAIKAFARDDVWADSGMRWVFHYDGTAWKVVVTGDTYHSGKTAGYGPYISQIAGNPGEAPYFLIQGELNPDGGIARLDEGGVLRRVPKLYTGTQWNGLFVLGSDVWLVGQGSAIQHGYVGAQR